VMTDARNQARCQPFVAHNTGHFSVVRQYLIIAPAG